MLSMTMRCDGLRSETILKLNTENEKQQFHQAQMQEKSNKWKQMVVSL